MTAWLIAEHLTPWRLKQVGVAATFAGVALGAWGAFFSWPYEIVVSLLLVAPWVALGLAATAGGRLSLTAVRIAVQPTVLVLWLLPASALAYRSLDLHLLDGTPIFVLIAVSVRRWPRSSGP